MKEPAIDSNMKTLFLVNAILGVISCVIPGIITTIISVVILGLSIYQLVKLPKTGKWRTSPVLLIIATALDLVTAVISATQAGKAIAAGALTNQVEDGHLVKGIIGGLMIVAVLAIASWIIRIVGTVFAFIAYSRANKALTAAVQQAAYTAQADPSVMTDAPAPTFTEVTPTSEAASQTPTTSQTSEAAPAASETASATPIVSEAAPTSEAQSASATSEAPASESTPTSTTTSTNE
ncbi:hypothetical protein [Lacticaseibacillus nasuensis]|uniref:Uncharacterized protein n=1 Tax=Lacticaseibacillus nasuensis JCM 17158 TaxID=1291734 RepID=A0A0R1JR68_9LACO|nr:hypothetical protein [Lacticaseibacillus nasuensis]KRK71113.1 hypothetical protein FD02_GL000298 [Lacticaseibacillus nasuensis JCM 17158]